MLLFFLSQLFFRSLCSPAQRPFTLFRNKDVVSDTCVVGWQLALKRRPIVDQPNGGQVASVGPLAPASAFNAERGGLSPLPVSHYAAVCAHFSARMLRICHITVCQCSWQFRYQYWNRIIHKFPERKYKFSPEVLIQLSRKI